MNENEVTAIVLEFTQAFVAERLRQLGQVWAGLDAAPQAHELLTRLYGPEGIEGTMEPVEWLRMALYGAGLTDGDADEMRLICQGMAEWLFSVPGASGYSIPDEWAATPMGALWWRALLRTEGDALITLAEAAHLSGVPLTTLASRVERGALRSFVNAAAPARQGRTLVRRSDVLALAEN